jgi:hypothetical protein
MADQKYRFIRQAAQIADQLDQHAAGDKGKRYDGRNGRGGDAGSKAPVRIDVTSAVHDHDRDQILELGIRQAILETLDGPGLEIPLSDRSARGALLERLLDDETAPESVTEHTTSAMRRHFAVLTCVLADVEGYVRMRCPRNHAPDAGLPNRTIVPAALLNIPTGLVICVHPDCDDALGVPRMLNLVEEMLSSDPDTELGIEEVAFLLRISTDAAKARIRRAREKGYDVPVVGFRTSPKGQQQALHRLADLIKANNIARDLGFPNWPKQSRRGRPHPST